MAGRCLFSSVSGEEFAPCQPGTVTLDVATAAELQNMIAAIKCTGEGTFNVFAYGGLQLAQRIEVSNQKNVTVTGFRYDSTTIPRAGIYAESGSGLFLVSNGSALILNGLMLEGGTSEYGGAVDVHSSSYLGVVGCSFNGNNASRGGDTISCSNGLMYYTQYRGDFEYK